MVAAADDDGNACSPAHLDMKLNYFKFRKKAAQPLGTLLVLFVIVFALTSHWAQACSSFKRIDRIRIRRNGYTDVVVAIHEDVEENIELVEQIKEAFSLASELLFNATKKRLYFREITIVIPSSWKLENYYDDFNTEFYDGILQNATWETYDQADFCVENRDLFTIDTPFVVNYASECGESAAYISLTPEYFLDQVRSDRLFGPYANVLIHNWAQFRYGVFSEHANRDMNGGREFYLNSKGEIEATRCSLEVKGRLKSYSDKSAASSCRNFEPDGLPSKDCHFEEETHSADAQRPAASLLYKPFLTQINEFCDNSTQNSAVKHNREAPNLQNRECNGQSVWEVMRNHHDFKDFVSMPNYFLKSVVPKFQILKFRARKIVLLIDKALRMETENKYVKIEKALKEYAKNILDDDVLVGIVHFDNFARITLPMTRVKDQTTRKKIKEFITPPLPNNKKSNIWNAISLGITLLKSTMNPNDKLTITGGNMIIITSSNLDPNYPNYPSQNETLMRNDIRLDLIRIGQENDEFFENYVQLTGGMSFLLSDANPFLDVENVLAFLSNRETKPRKKSIQVLNKNMEFSSTLPIMGSLYVDETMSSSPQAILKIVFNVENINDYLDINVYEPTSKKHPSKYNLKCKDSSLSSLIPRADLSNIQDVVCEFRRPLVGRWTYEILNPFDQKAKVGVKAFVYFHEYADESNYYANYYDRDDYKLKRHSDDIVAVPAGAAGFESEIRIEARWHRSKISWPAQSQKIYVSLSKGLKPILNATVKTLVLRPSGDIVELLLRDDGLEADRFRNDGVYSKFFANFNENGSYFAMVEITTSHFTRVHMQKLVGTGDLEFYPKIGLPHNVDETQLIKSIERIQRSVIVGYFKLDGFRTDVDLIPPSRVSDLSVNEIDYDKKLVKLSFTAPGDNLDLGRVSKYDLKCSSDLDFLAIFDTADVETSDLDPKLISNLTIVSSSFEAEGEQPIPNQAGYAEHVTLDLSNCESDMVACKIRSVDASNNTSPWSPLVSIKLSQEVRYAPQLRHFHSAEGGSSAMNNTSLDSSVEDALQSVEDKENMYSRFFIAFLVFLGLIFVVQIGMIIALTVYKLRDSRYEEIKPIRV